MTTLISYQSSGGDQGCCDATTRTSRNATASAAGRNHGAGREQAIENTRELAGGWLEQARANGQDITRAELAAAVTHEPLFDLATPGGSK
jgi:hypothetical protein